jgi:hypothetical protein
LHDDVGSQLVQLISLTDLGTDPAIRSNAEQCLLDLRLIVDSMDSRNEPWVSFWRVSGTGCNLCWIIEA